MIAEGKEIVAQSCKQRRRDDISYSKGILGQLKHLLINLSERRNIHVPMCSGLFWYYNSNDDVQYGS